MNFPVDELRNMRTPVYFYDTTLLKRTLADLKESLPSSAFRVHYAMKANANPLLLGYIKDAGLGIDAVSGPEIEAALASGFDAGGIVFAGVGKRDDEIELALRVGIGTFNVESLPELENISRIAGEMGMKANVALRVNPDIDAHTHHYITTGIAENKFGINLENLDAAVDAALNLTNVSLEGLHFHIGSQITDNTPFALLGKKINELQAHFNHRGIIFKTINVGGGLGIDYDDPDSHPVPDFKSYFSTFAETVELRAGQELHFELGRAIVAQCGSLVTRALYVKEGTTKKFAIVDAGMTDLIRPALYQAHHKIENITSESECEIYDVVGPICESSDVFAESVSLPRVTRGDILAIRSAGAYGEVMASCYNLRSLPGSCAI